MVIDCFSYNGEFDLLKIRLEILSPYVDRFVIVEAKTTFSGNKKPLYFSREEKWFEKYWNKIDYFVIYENYSQEEKALAENSPNTQGAKHWKREFLQKESIKKALVNIDENATVYIGDVDEIWNPTYKPELPIEKLLLHVYAYWLDYHSNEVFWGPIVGRWGDIKPYCLNHLRSNTEIRGQNYAGWHFTSMGGLKEVKRKISDSYTSESYNTPEVRQKLADRLEEGTDYLGRPFTFRVDRGLWPKYLKVYTSKYKHLLYENKSKPSAAVENAAKGDYATGDAKKNYKA